MAKITPYVIDTGVPVPEDSNIPVPIDKLEVGESIVFPLKDRGTVQSRASNYKKRQGKVFIIKKEDKDSARVWRKV